EHRRSLSVALPRVAGLERRDSARAERTGLRAHSLCVSVANAGVSHADVSRVRGLDRDDRDHHRAVAVAAARARDRVPCISRLLLRALAVAERASRRIVNRRIRDRLAAGLYVCLVGITCVTVIWTMRQGWAVYKLRRGVGDTWFYAADGKPWFRMD